MTSVIIKLSVVATRQMFDSTKMSYDSLGYFSLYCSNITSLQDIALILYYPLLNLVLITSDPIAQI